MAATSLELSTAHRRAGRAGLVGTTLAYLRPYRKLVAVVAVAIVCEVAFAIFFPLSVKLLIDNAVTVRDDRLLTLTLAALFGSFFLAAVAGVVRDRLCAVIGSRLSRDLSARMFDHLQRLSVDFFARADTGNLLAGFSSDLVVIDNALSRALPRVAKNGIQLVVAIVLLFLIDWRLAIVTLLSLPLATLGPRLLGPRASAAADVRRQGEAAAIGLAQENIAGQVVIRAFGLERLTLQRFEQHLAALARLSAREGFLSRLVGRTTDLGVSLAQLIVIGVGILLVFNGYLSVGSLVGFMGLLLSLGFALTYVSESMPDWIRARTSMRRMDELLSEQPSVSDKKDARPLERLAGNISFENVSFGYADGRLNLADVSFSFNAGESVAFVGRSGSGKSTILSLLMRFYDPQQGRVHFDGQDLRDVTQESLRAQIGVVFQDTFLFNLSIGDNIRLGRSDATDAEVEQAARAAQLHDLILAMPEGYATPVGERGSRLSGGQRQRVALARAILRDPAILILDEATSALDPATEADFNATLAEIAADRTVISVTHRLAGAVDADRIFVMDQGRLVEQGTHDALLQQRGVYGQFWEQQMGLALTRDGLRAEVTPARLRSIPLFADIDESHLRAIADRFSTERAEPGETIVDEGDVGDRFYIIVRGEVDVLKAGPDDTERELAVLQEGDFFGELALLRDVPRTASVRARSPVVTLALPRDQFLKLLEADPEIRASVELIAGQRRAQLSTAH